MSNRFFKSVTVQLVGALAVRLSVYGFNPIGIGMFSAIQGSRLIKWPTFFVMMLSMLFYYDMITIVKYIMIMLAVGVMIAMIRKRDNTVNEYAAACIAGGVCGAMEFADITLSGEKPDYMIVSLVAIATFSFSLVASYLIRSIENMGNRYAEHQWIEKEKTGKKQYEERINMVAAAFEKMSKSITSINGELSSIMGNDIDGNSVNCITNPDIREEIRQVNNIWMGKLNESREAMALQLKEMSGILKDCSDNTGKVEKEKKYFVLHGMAKKNNENEEVSGDSFTCMEINGGKVLLSISDGMGHGEKASKDSKRVLALLEDMMDSGFSEETSLKLINSMFTMETDVINPTTLDVGIIDLYSGVCNFVKSGSATTFIKRKGWIDAISSDTMPIGAANVVDTDQVTKKLYSGDYVVMVSDGVMDALPQERGVEYISQFLIDEKSSNPQEIAQKLLERVTEVNQRNISDDMTVMVAGVWEKTA